MLKTMLYCLIATACVACAVDSCIHHNDYKVSARDLTIIGSNLIGDVKAVTTTGDTVFVYGKYSSLLYDLADTTWQTKFNYLEPVGFTTDSVVVKPY